MRSVQKTIACHSGLEGDKKKSSYRFRDLGLDLDIHRHLRPYTSKIDILHREVDSHADVTPSGWRTNLMFTAMQSSIVMLSAMLADELSNQFFLVILYFRGY